MGGGSEANFKSRATLGIKSLQCPYDSEVRFRALPIGPAHFGIGHQIDETHMKSTGTRFVGRSILRREDQRLLTGRGQFIADLVFPGMLHAVFVRSQVAHARLRAVDLSRASSALPL